MPTREPKMDTPVLAAIGADASKACAARLARVTGTHGLLLDGMSLPIPAAAGVARWTVLEPGSRPGDWCGPLCAAADALPFGDGSFCVVLVRFPGPAVVEPTDMAAELGRLLAPHGTLLVTDIHARSLWNAGVAPGRWERALRGAGLDVAPTERCGSPWPRARGAAGLPRWLVRGMGGAWVIQARRRTQSAIPLRRSATSRRAAEPATLVPGAQRQRA